MDKATSLIPYAAKPRLFCYSRYDGMAPFSNHLQGLTRLLEERFTLTPLEDAEFFVSLDHDPQTLKKVEKVGIPADRRFLIVREPRQVHPYSHSKAAEAAYAKILYMGAVGPQGISNYWPYDSPADFIINEPMASRSERAVAIAGWRISFIRGSLYGLRALAFSEASVDLFGRDWDASWMQKSKELLANGLIAVRYAKHANFDFRQIWCRPENFKGTAPSKFPVLGAYKVSLVIENSLDYFSEKLFDSLVAGTIPVYCGPDPSLLGIPSELVIWCEPNISSIRGGLEAAQKIDYVKWRKLLDMWLLTFDDNSKMRSKAVWQDVVGTLHAQMTQNGAENE